MIDISGKDLQTLRADAENEGVKQFHAGQIMVEGSTRFAMSFTQSFKLK